MYRISSSFLRLWSCSPEAVAFNASQCVRDEPVTSLVRMRVNTACPQRRAPVVIPEEIAAHGRSAFGEEQRNAGQAATIFPENPLEIMHRVMMRIPGEPTALVIEVAPVKLCQTVGNNKSLGSDTEASFIACRKLI